MTEDYLHIVARMADYMATHPYSAHVCLNSLSEYDSNFTPTAVGIFPSANLNQSYILTPLIDLPFQPGV